MDSIALGDIDYDRVRVDATEAGQQYNPSTDVVQFAYMSQPWDKAKPQGTDLITGSWEIATTTAGTVYYARCLIGTTTNGKVLAKGKYYRWVKITDNPTAPMKPCGTLTVY